MVEKFNTKKIAEIFDLPYKKTLDILKKNNSLHELKYIQAYKKDIYQWYLFKISKECFKELNRNNKYKTLKGFISSYKKISEKEKIDLEKLKKQQKEESLRIRKEQKMLEDEKQRIRNQYISETNEYYRLNQERWFNNNSNYILHVGETNSGKTYNAIQRLKESKSGQYLAPLRLLAQEIYETLNEHITCDLVTGEEVILNGGTISSRTIEMVDFDNFYDCVIIDESFMITDPDRGRSWLMSILHVKASEIHIITNIETSKLIEDILIKTNKKYIKNEYERKVPLIIGDKSFARSSDEEKNKKNIFVTFSRMNCLIEKHQFEKRGYNVSIIYGNLPPETKKKQIDLFRNGNTDILISTDAIGMGLNLPCDNVIFLEDVKFDGKERRKLNSTEINQIGGRAGRYGLSEQGNIYGYNQNIHNYIKETINKKNNINKKAIYGVDFDILKNIKGDNIINKLNIYYDLDLIPNDLKSIIIPESKSKYTEILNSINNKYHDKISISDMWSIINIPFYDTSLLRNILDSVANKKKLIINYNYKTNVNDFTSLSSSEDLIKKFDTYIYFSNKFKDLIDEDNKIGVLNLKNILLENIDKYLLNKKLSSVKKCISCKKDISIFSHHKKCNNCYMSEDYNNYFDYY